MTTDLFRQHVTAAALALAVATPTAACSSSVTESPADGGVYARWDPNPQFGDD